MTANVQPQIHTQLLSHCIRGLPVQPSLILSLNLQYTTVPHHADQNKCYPHAGEEKTLLKLPLVYKTFFL